MSAVEDLTRDDSPRASTAAGAAAAAGGPSPFALTRERKKHFAHHADERIPLLSLGAELRLLGSACSPAEAGVKNCKSCVHCLHGLGLHKRGVWDAKGAAAAALLGADPHLRARPADSHVGLRNLGATCYFNTLLQCLYMTAAFRRAVYLFEPPAAPMPHMQLKASASAEDADLAAALAASTADAAGSSASGGSGEADHGLPAFLASKPQFLQHLQDVFTHLEHSRRSPYDPAHMVDALGLSRGDQQDVHELMNLLVFQVLERGLGASRNPICRATIPRLFTGHTVHVMQGQSCGHTSERVSEFHDLSQVQIKGKKNLQGCLDDYFKEEHMEHDKPEYRWKCGTCNKRENATRYTYLKDLPPLLILQLGRFEFDMATLGKKKLADSIALPQFLDLSKYMQPTTTAALTGAAAPAASSAPHAHAAATSSADPGAGDVAVAPVSMDDSDATSTPAAPAAATPISAVAGGKRGRPARNAGGAAAAASATGTHVSVNMKRGRGQAAAATAQPEESVPVAHAYVPTSSLSSLPPPQQAPAAKGRPSRKKAATGASAAAAAAHAPAAVAAPSAAALPASERVDLTLDEISAPSPAEAARFQRTQQLSSDEALARQLQSQPEKKPRAKKGKGALADAAAADDDAPPTKRQKTGPKAAAPKKMTKKQQKEAEAEAAAIAAAVAAEAASAGSNDVSGADSAVDPSAPPSDGADIVVDAGVNRDGPNMYQLVAVLLHKGTSANRGHYTAEIFDLERNEWFTFDDGKVSSKSRRKKTETAKAAEAAVDATTVESASHVTPDVETATAAVAAAATTPAATSSALAVDTDADVTMDQSAETGETPADPIAVDPQPGESAAPDADATAATGAASPAASSDAVPTAAGDSATAAIDVEAEGEAAEAPQVAPPAAPKRTRRSKQPKAAEMEAAEQASRSIAHVAAGRPSRASAEIARFKINDQHQEVSPPPAATAATPTATAASKSKSRKFCELDDEEKGDEESYDPATAGKAPPKRRGRKPKAAPAESKAKSSKADKAKAEVSVLAASTAYILIYRRRDTIRADWNPFEQEEQELARMAAEAIAAATGTPAPAPAPSADESSSGSAMDTSDNTAPPASDTTGVAAAAAAAAIGVPPATAPATAAPVVPSVFLSASAPRVFLEPVEAANREFEVELQEFKEREARLNVAIELRKQRVERLMDVVEPDDFETVAAAVDASQPPPPAKVDTPTAVKDEDSPTSGQRRSARKSMTKAATGGATQTASAASSAAAAPSVPAAPPAKPLSEVRMGHYVSTQWLSAYLTGWLIEKEQQAADAGVKEEGASATAEDGAAAAAAATPGATKDEPMETDEDVAKEEAHAEAESGAVSPVADEASTAATTAAASTDSATAATAAASSPTAATPAAPAAPAPRVLTPLQLFLQSHPKNDELPFPGDLVESVNTLRCSHGKLNPTRLSSAKRISCDAYRILFEDYTHWKEKQQTRVKNEQDEKVKMEDDVKIIEQDDSTNGPAAAAAAATATAAIAVPSSPAASSSCLSSFGACPCSHCSLAGLTDADLCPECARATLLGETMLQEQHEENMRVFNAYVAWDAEQEKKGVGAADVKNAHCVSNLWWRNWKKQLDAAAKALQLTPISSKKPRGRPATAASSNAAPAAPKQLPVISTDDDINEDIACEHGNLKPDSKFFTVSGAIWERLRQLHPRSQPVRAFIDPGHTKERECATCVEERERESSNLKQHKEKMRAEKGKLKFIKSRTQITDFPAPTKAPHDGTYHILPTDWAIDMWAYFNTQGEEQKPPPVSTATLVCKHGGLLFEPRPEEDKSSLPQAAAQVAASKSSVTAPVTEGAASSGSSTAAVASALCSAQRESRLHTTPTGQVTIVDDADYEHLKAQKWITPDSVDIVMKVGKNPVKNSLGEISTWTHIQVDFSPKPCGECIAERLNSEHSDSLVFEDQLFFVHRIRSEEKVSTEDDAAIAASMAIMEGRRASTRRRAPTRAPPRRPVEVVASSTDSMLNFKLKIFETCGMEVGHQEVIWVKEDNSTVLLDDENKTLSDYGIPANAQLRLRLNPFAQQKLFEEASGKNSIEHGFRGTALSSAPPPPLPSAGSLPLPPPVTAATHVPSSPVAAATPATPATASSPTTPAATVSDVPAQDVPASTAPASPAALPTDPPATTATTADTGAADAPMDVSDSVAAVAGDVRPQLPAVRAASPTVSDLEGEEEEEPADSASHPPSDPAPSAAVASAAPAPPAEPLNDCAASAPVVPVPDAAAPIAMDVDEEPQLQSSALVIPEPAPTAPDSPVCAAPMTDASAVAASASLDDALAPALPIASEPEPSGASPPRSSKVAPPQLPAMTAEACAEAAEQKRAIRASQTIIIASDDDDDAPTAAAAAARSDEQKETHDDRRSEMAAAPAADAEEASSPPPLVARFEAAQTATTTDQRAVHTKRKRSKSRST